MKKAKKKSICKTCIYKNKCMTAYFPITCCSEYVKKIKAAHSKMFNLEELVREKINKFMCKTAIEPNIVLLNEDYFHDNTKVTKIFGLKVVIVEKTAGLKFPKVALI